MSRAVACLAILFVCTSAYAQSATKSKAKPASPPAQITAKQDYLVPKDGYVTTPYCDRALPYKYQAAPTSVQLAVNAQNDDWMGYLAKNYAKLEGPKSSFAPFTKDSVLPPASTVTPQTPPAPTPDTADFDPRKDADNWLYDNGSPLVTPADTTMTAPRAERLLVRTLFGPDPFTAPCSYHYLTSAVPPADGAPVYSPSGQLENPVTPGTLGTYHFSFLDKAAPEFYLINITQWSDAPAPTGAPSAPTAPYQYYAAKDTWLLLNFKHPEKNQDITKLVFRAGLAPQIVADAVPELMGKRVILLGIQLAPTVPVPASAYLKSQKLDTAITPTEQAWFDNVKVQYKLHADAVIALEIQDLDALVQAAIAAAGASNILPAASNTPPQQPSATPPPMATGPVNGAKAIISGSSPVSGKATLPSSLAVPDPIETALTQIKAALAVINPAAAKLATSAALKPSPLLLFLRGAPLVDTSRGYGNKCSSGTTPLLSYGEAGSSYVTLNQSVLDCIDSIGTMSQQTPTEVRAQEVAKAAALSDLQADVESLKANQSILEGDLKAYTVSSSNKPLPASRSLYQGVYVASLVYNIQGLPLNITPSWSAGFSTAASSAGAATPTVKSSAHGPSPAPDDPSLTGDENGLSSLPDQQTSASSTPPTRAGGSNTSATVSKPAKPSSVTPVAKPSKADSQSADPSTPAAPAATPPADVCTAALAADNASQASCTATDGIPILDELFAHFDFTAAVSVTGYKDLTIPSASTTGSSVATTATVTRENAYGIVDLFIIREDLANPPILGIPHFAVGIPFAGQVFDKPYFAIGETINIPKLLGKSSKLASIPGFSALASDQFPLQIHPVFGYVWNKESSATNGVIRKYRDFRPQWSIEVPFRNFTKLISNFAKSSSK